MMTFYNFLLLNKYDDMAFFFRKKAPLSVWQSAFAEN